MADTGNNRVLEYTPTFTVGEAATTVIGQDFFTTDVAGSGVAGERDQPG